MADEEKVEGKAPEEAGEGTKAKKSGGMMMMIIIGVGAFIVGVVAFSFMMGVFSSPQKVDEEKSKDKSAEVAAQHSEESKSHEGEASEDSSYMEDVAKLEDELFGVHDVTEADNMDEIVALANGKDSVVGSHKKQDSVQAANWIKAEKIKLASERAELDKRKKELDAQEYRLKQLVAKANQMQSARVGSLAKLYDGMKPSQVAPLIVQLNDKQAVEILLKMKPGNAAKILGAINPKRAARISSKMITLTEE